MKKILVLMVAVFAMTMTASAQKKITEEQRNQVIENLIGRMTPVDGSCSSRQSPSHTTNTGW